jgi:hypothetical protein
MSKKRCKRKKEKNKGKHYCEKCDKVGKKKELCKPLKIKK